METYGVNFEGFEPYCGWPSYEVAGTAMDEDAQWLLENAEEDLNYYRQIKADIAAHGLEIALRQSTRKVKPSQTVVDV